MSFKSFYILLFASLSLVACKKNIVERDEHSAFIGGEIINPNSNYIVLTKSHKVIDTITLDKKNRFSYRLTNFKPGLYDFHDGREQQFILIQPKDSLLLRLNTIEFDESLVYTGIGAKENNYLMDMFLENEREDNENKTLIISQNDPIPFQEKLNEIKAEKLNRLNKFIKKNKTTKMFNKIAKANINYRYYSSKEFYPFANYSKSELDMFNSLPDDFYAYRKGIDYNDELLKDYPPYNNFLKFHINNIALQEHLKHSDDTNYDEYSIDYNLDKITAIDNNINNEYKKNSLLYYTMIHFIHISKDTDGYDELYKSFNEKCTNKKLKESAFRIVNSYKRLKPGLSIPSVVLLDKEDKEVELAKLIKKPAVVYFWDKKNKLYLIDSHKRAQELEKKYPEVLFLSINTDSISFQEQVNILNRHKVKIKNEYRFKFPKKSKAVLSVRPITNVFIINGEQKIVNPKSNMFNISFEQELLGVINQ